MSITRMGHITLSVTDLDRSVEFAQDIIGLRLVERDADAAYLTSTARHHQLELRRGEEHRIVSLALDVAGEAEYAAVLDDVLGAGFEVREDGPLSSAIEEAFWFDIADGPTIQICRGVAAVADEPYPVYGVRPRKFGHATFATPDLEGLERTFADVLGFRISDRIPGTLAWMRCNTDHHGIGLVKGEPGLNHYAFEIESWSAVETLADHMIQRDVRFIWGPGRHGPGNNIFAYIEDADGSMCEFFTDILQVTDESTYEAKEWEAVATSLNQWGPGPEQRWFEYSTPHASSSTREAVSS